MAFLTHALTHTLYIKAFVGLLVVGLLLIAVRVFLNYMMPFGSHKDSGKLTRILDVCAVGHDRHLIHFASPFSQGILLISPKGDQIVILPAEKDSGA